MEGTKSRVGNFLGKIRNFTNNFMSENRNMIGKKRQNNNRYDRERDRGIGGRGGIGGIGRDRRG